MEPEVGGHDGGSDTAVSSIVINDLTTAGPNRLLLLSRPLSPAASPQWRLSRLLAVFLLLPQRSR